MKRGLPLPDFKTYLKVHYNYNSLLSKQRETEISRQKLPQIHNQGHV